MRVLVLLWAATALMASCAAHSTLTAPRSSSAMPGQQKQTVPATRRIHVLDSGGVTAEVPARWFTVAYRGMLPTVYFPERFVSDEPLRGPCLTQHRSQDYCTGKNYFPPAFTTPRSGVVALWSEAEFPSANGDGLVNLTGRRTTIDHRPAKLYAGSPMQECPTGTATEVDAEVIISADSPGNRVDLTACFGPHAPPAERTAVYAMLRSLRITR